MARARLAAVIVGAFAFSTASQAGTGPVPLSTARPTGLHGFLLRASEARTHTFSRTPSFAWNPVAGAVRYQFELATSRRFTDNSVVWSTNALRTPVAAVPLSLPWSSGNAYSLYAHVRAVTRRGASKWSAAYGFRMRWSAVPKPLPSYPGLIRWTTVSGANAYDVWFVDAGKVFTTLSNVADEREYYTLHQDPTWTGTVHWRIRAVRWLYGAPQNGLPVASRGPWSPIYTSFNPPFALGPLSAIGTVSDTVSNALTPRAHQLMPAFLFYGNESLWGNPEQLYHVYVFTDRDCLNPVFWGAVVGSPAYAPRPTGPLALPADAPSFASAQSEFLTDGDQGAVYTYDGELVKTTELDTGTSSGGDTGGSGSGGGGGGGGTGGNIIRSKGARVDLWDTDWPNGRYYWTVIPIDARTSAPISTSLSVSASAGSTNLTVGNAKDFAVGDVLQVGSGGNQENVVIASVNANVVTIGAGLRNFHGVGDRVVKPGGAMEYHDTELAQDACASGRVLSFGKVSQPVVTGSAAPFVSGLAPNGRLYAARRPRPQFYGTPLVAWQPALGADEYQVEVSRTRYPWRRVGRLTTPATSAILPLGAGTWYYRVRGLNESVPGGHTEMSWSRPVQLVLTRPRFRVVG